MYFEIHYSIFKHTYYLIIVGGIPKINILMSYFVVLG